MSKFERLLLILNLIRSRPGIRAGELALEAGVSQRTIYRDILALAAQYPIFYANGYRLLPTAFLKTLNFTRSEYAVLQMALSCPALKRPDLKVPARSLKAKIDTVVNPIIRNFSQVPSDLCIVPACNEYDQSKFQSFCSVLEEAVDHCQIVEVSHTKGSKKVSETVYPYTLVYLSHCRPQDWFLIGYSTLKKDFEGFKLNSLSQVSLSNKTFQRDENFSLQGFLDCRWETEGGQDVVVKVRFTGEAALEVIETKHHPKEKVTKVGEKEAIYTVTVKGTDGIIRWIMGFGPEAEVVEPKEVRKKVKENASRLSKLYSEGRERAANSLRRNLQATPKIGNRVFISPRGGP